MTPAASNCCDVPPFLNIALAAVIFSNGDDCAVCPKANCIARATSNCRDFAPLPDRGSVSFIR